jgi:hypothetical protein
LPAAHGRTYVEIDALLSRADLDAAVKALARRAFRGLAEAEAAVHGTAIEDVHFHEVGAVDAIVDVVGACAGIVHLRADEVVVSRVPLGQGMTRGAHGKIPLPAPATVHLLRGAPVYGIEERGETVTPTGAAILAAAATRYGPLPSMRVERTGLGAGARDSVSRPNLLRLLVGDADTQPATNECFVLEANVDDMSPEILAYVSERLFDAGALDVWTTPIQMKKGRTASSLSVLCADASRDRLLSIVLRETTTLGVRFHAVLRRTLERTTRTVATPWGSVRLKLGLEDGVVVNVAPEYEDCRRVALEAAVPLKEVYRAALAGFDADVSARPRNEGP